MVRTWKGLQLSLIFLFGDVNFGFPRPAYKKSGFLSYHKRNYVVIELLEFSQIQDQIRK